MVPQLLGWDQQCIGPPNVLAEVFKKQEISQQVLLLVSETQSFHIIYSALRRHFSRYSTSDRRKTKTMCLIPVSTLHGVYFFGLSLFIMDQDDVLHAIYMFHNFLLIGF